MGEFYHTQESDGDDIRSRKRSILDLVDEDPYFVIGSGKRVVLDLYNEDPCPS